MHSANLLLIPISSCPPSFHLFPPKTHNFHYRIHLAPRPIRKMAFLGESGVRIKANGSDGVQTLTEYMGKGGENVGDELVLLFSHLEYACKRIAALVASPLNSDLARSFDAAAGGAERDKPKPLDIVANDIILSSLKNSGKVAVMASEEDDAPIWLADDGPSDGSRNIDASIPTGTIFGIYKRLEELDHLPETEKAMLNSLQSGSKLMASGYVLYSSATILCTSFGSGTHAFTLDHSTGDFILTHPNIKIPPRAIPSMAAWSLPIPKVMNNPLSSNPIPTKAHSKSNHKIKLIQQNPLQKTQNLEPTSSSDINPYERRNDLEKLVPTMSEIMEASRLQNLDIQLQTIGPFFRITAKGLESRRELGRAEGVIRVWFGGKILHLDSIRMKRETIGMEKSIFGIGLFIGAVAIRHGYDCGCTKAELLAIYDTHLYHSKLVRFYKRLGFKQVYEVEGSSIGDMSHMLVWGGVGTRMDANIEHLMIKWCSRFKPSPPTI